MIRAMIRLFLATALMPMGAAAVQAAERSFLVTSFDEIRIGAGDDVVIDVGPAPSVRASGPQELLDRMSADVNSRRLRIGMKGRQLTSRNLGSSGQLSIRITTPSIDRVYVAGSTNVRLSDVRSRDLTLLLSGSGDVSTGKVDSEKMALILQGSGRISVQGRCDSLTLSASGPGQISAENLKCRFVEASVSGPATVQVFASRQAGLRSSGSGELVVHGEPKVCEVQTMGSGTALCAAATADAE